MMRNYLCKTGSKIMYKKRNMIIGMGLEESGKG